MINIIRILTRNMRLKLNISHIHSLVGAHMVASSPASLCNSFPASMSSLFSFLVFYKFFQCTFQSLIVFSKVIIISITLWLHHESLKEHVKLPGSLLFHPFFNLLNKRYSVIELVGGDTSPGLAALIPEASRQKVQLKPAYCSYFLWARGS